MSIRTITIVACAFWLASTTSWAQEADVRLEELEQSSIEELKRDYLSCDRESLGGRLTRAGVMQCSIIYEDLKRRAFHGDFEKLLAWSRASPSNLGDRR